MTTKENQAESAAPVSGNTLIKFLCGEEAYKGYIFGDRINGAQFWWRKDLRLLFQEKEQELERLRSENERLQNQIEIQLKRRHIICPFCYENDFDKAGLKDHLTRCEVFSKTEIL